MECANCGVKHLRDDKNMVPDLCSLCARLFLGIGLRVLGDNDKFLQGHKVFHTLGNRPDGVRMIQSMMDAEEAKRVAAQRYWVGAAREPLATVGHGDQATGPQPLLFSKDDAIALLRGILGEEADIRAFTYSQLPEVHSMFSYGMAWETRVEIILTEIGPKGILQAMRAYLPDSTERWLQEKGKASG